MQHRQRFMLDVDSEGFPHQYDRVPHPTSQRIGSDEIEIALESDLPNPLGWNEPGMAPITWAETTELVARKGEMLRAAEAERMKVKP